MKFNKRAEGDTASIGYLGALKILLVILVAILLVAGLWGVVAFVKTLLRA